MSTSIVAVLALASCCTPGGREPGVRRTDPGIARRVVIEDAGVGLINSITVVSRQGKPAIAVGGTNGVAFLSMDYLEEQLVRFEGIRMTTAVPVDVEGDGLFEFMDRGGSWSPVKLVSHEGKLLWTFPDEGKSDRSPAADQMVAGDLDGDGKAEFAVGMNGGGGLFVLGKDGRIAWRKDASNVHCVEIVDLDSDGKPEIVHVDGRFVVIRDRFGAEIRRFLFAVHPLTPLVRRSMRGDTEILGEMGGALHSFNSFGAEAPRVPSPGGHGDTENILPVLFNGTQYYAATNRRSYDHTIGFLYVYDAAGRVLHEEVFSARVKALAAVTDPSRTDSELLLVAVGGQVIELRKQ
ncbi:MAG: hypothetical protein IT452_11235 [Planctomycetia bacterium]|nr:hypothetical protein [Planctomycetia bacterium]